MAVEINWTTQSLEDIINVAEFIAQDSERYAQKFKQKDFLIEQPY